MARIIPEEFPAGTGGGTPHVTGVQSTFVYQPGGLPIDNVYISWLALMADLALQSGPKIIQIDDSFTSPAVIPSGTYDVSDTYIVGNSEIRDVPPVMQIDDGAIFTNLEEIRFVDVRGNASSPVFTATTVKQIIFRDSIISVNSGMSPLFSSSSTFDIVLDRTSFIGSDLIVDVTAGTTTFYLENQSSIVTGVISSAITSAVDFVCVDSNVSVGAQAGVLGATSNSLLSDSNKVSYDGTSSGLVSDNVQDAIDEVASGGGGGLSSLQQAYVAGNSITTSALNGDLDVSGTEAISFDAASDSNFTVSSANLSIGTSTSGSTIINSAGILDLDASDSITLDSSGGSIGIGTDANANEINIGTGAAARVITVGNATGSTEVNVITGTGSFSVSSTNPEGTSIATLTTTGTNGNSTELFIGSSDPSGTVTGLAGSLFMRDTSTAGELYVNTSTASGTTWSQVVLSSDPSTVSLQDAYDNGSSITTSPSGGDFEVTGSEAIEFYAESHSSFIVDGGNLDFATETSGSLSLSSIGVLNIDSEGGLSLNASGGSINIGTDSDTTPINIGTGATARNIRIGNLVGTTGVDIITGTGGALISTSNPEGDPVATLISTGSLGDSSELFVGRSDPSGLVMGLAGSLFMRDTLTTGELYINTSSGSGTSWEEVAFVSSPTLATLQDVYENGNSILTSATDGDFDVSGTESISLDSSSDSNFTVDGADLDFETTTSGTLSVTSAGSLDVDAVGLLSINSSGGAIGIGTDADANAINIGTGAAARVVTVGNVSGSTAVNIVTGTGGLGVSSTNAASASVVTLGTTGASGDSIELFVGSSDPSGSVTGLAGSLFMRDTSTTGELYINTSTGSGTTWSQIALASSPSVASLQNAYENGNTIITSGTDGDFDVSGSEAISLDASSASNFTVAGAALSIGTTTSGAVTLVSAGLMDLDSVGVLNINSSGGTIGLGTDANANAINIGTGSASRVITIGNATGSTAVNISTGAGGLSVSSTNPATAPIATFTTTGTSGDSTQLFVGTSDPSGSITGLAGSLFMRDTSTTGELYINTSTGSGTTWSQIALASSPSVVTLQNAYENGNTITTSGTDGAFDVSGTEAISLDASSASNFTVTGATLSLGTTTSGAVTLSSAGIMDLESVGALNINSSGGLIGIGTDTDANAIDIGTGAAARVIAIGNVTGNTSVDILTGTGGLSVSSTNAATASVAIFAATGTAGDSAELFVGTSDPSGSITGLAGSMFLRDTSTDGELYINTSAGSGTTWSQVAFTSDITTFTLQDVYENGNAIITTGTDGAFDVSGSEAISLDASSASNFTVAGAALSLGTTASGATSISSAGILDLDSVNALNINSSGGVIGIGTDANANAINIGTGAAARAITIGNVTGSTAVDVSTGTGGMSVSSTNAAAASIITLTTSGAAGDSAELFVGTSDPSGSITGLAGSMFLRDTSTSGELYVNTSTGSGTTWGQVVLTSDLPVTTLQGAYEDGNSIITSSSDGDFDVSGTEAISLVASSASNFTVAGAALSLGTTTSGTVSVVSAGIMELDSTGLLSLNSSGGVIGIGTDSVSSVISVGNTSGTTAVNILTGTGSLSVSSTNAETAAVVTLTTTGTNGNSTGLFVGSSDPSGTVTGLAGSLFMQDTSTDGKLYVNTSVGSGTTWSEVSLGSGPAGGTLQSVYEAGNTIVTSSSDGDFSVSGTEAVILTAGGANSVTITGGDGATAGDVNLTGGSGAATSGDVNIIGGSGGSNAGGEVTVSAGNSSSGDGSGVVISGSSAVTSGEGGHIIIAPGSSAGSNAVGTVLMSGVRNYGKSSSTPIAVSGGFVDGDKYYNSTLQLDMRYDGTRSKWLSVDSAYLLFGRNSGTGSGVYYRGINGLVHSATIGYFQPHDGTIVGLGYTRGDTDAAIFSVVEGGTVAASLASTATSGGDNSLDGNFTAGGILAVQNTGANATTSVTGWLKVKWRG